MPLATPDAPVRSGKRVRGRFILDSVEEKAPEQLLKPALTAEWLGLMHV